MNGDDAEVGSSLKLLAKTSVIVLIFVILSKLLAYLYKIIIARGFGPSEYGLFTLALIVTSIFVSFASLGLSDGLLRHISLYKNKDMKKAKYLLKLTFHINLFSGVIAGVLMFLLAETIAINFFHDPELVIFLKAFSFAVPIAIIGGLFLTVLRSFEKIAMYTFINSVFQNGIRILVIGTLLFIGLTRSAIITSYLVAVIAFAIMAYIASRKEVLKVLKSKNLEKGKKKLRNQYFSYSWPIVFLGIIGGIFYWVDSFVIGFFMSSADVGFYGIAFTIVSLYGIAPELFMQLFFPLVVREYSKKRMRVVQEVSKQVSKWIFALNLPLFVMIFIFPGAIINVLFGEAFIQGYNSLRILAVGGIVSSIFMILSTNLLSMKGKTKLMLMNVLVISVINLIMNIILVPRFGIVGAAFATSSTWVLLSLVLLFEVKSLVSVFPIRRKMLNLVLAVIIPTVIISYLKSYIPSSFISLITVALLFLLLYIIFAVLFKGLDRNDLMIWRTIKERFSK
ncbi:hypothetical protein CMI45_01300 [Candidatus Pacearchaeota archaeon]|nr:hypothetical protein [Candidatus Pacearchaeota archaeon]|tara:strand:- start:1447 stop:2970 length:1524 start_codon:yes stop_codon:yes gene_type:complete